MQSSPNAGEQWRSGGWWGASIEHLCQGLCNGHAFVLLSLLYNTTLCDLPCLSVQMLSTCCWTVLLEATLTHNSWHSSSSGSSHKGAVATRRRSYQGESCVKHHAVQCSARMYHHIWHYTTSGTFFTCMYKLIKMCRCQQQDDGISALEDAECRQLSNVMAVRD